MVSLLLVFQFTDCCANSGCPVLQLGKPKIACSPHVLQSEQRLWSASLIFVHHGMAKADFSQEKVDMFQRIYFKENSREALTCNNI